MIYPEIPKTKFRSTYIAGGIFSFLFGAILFALYFPDACKIMFGTKPWDWNAIGINWDFLKNIQEYVSMLVPVVVILMIGGSFLIGRSKSSTFAKLSMLACMIAILIKYAPFGLPESIAQYVELGVAVVGLALFVLSVVTLFLNGEKDKPYHANSFHLFAACYLSVFALFDSTYLLILGRGGAFSANYPVYVFPVLVGIFCIVAGIWLLSLMQRPEIEFGSNHMSKKKFEKLSKETDGSMNVVFDADEQAQTQVVDKKKQKEELKKQKEAAKLAKEQEKLNKKAAKTQAQEQNNPQDAEATNSSEPMQKPQEKVAKTAPKQEEKPAAKTAPKRALPPLQVGPDGVEYRIITQKLPNGKVVQLRIDKNGKPLPPLPKTK